MPFLLKNRKILSLDMSENVYFLYTQPHFCQKKGNQISGIMTVKGLCWLEGPPVELSEGDGIIQGAHRGAPGKK